MRHKLRTFALLAIAIALRITLVCSLTSAQQNPATEEKTEEAKTGTISGTVVNDSGQPLAGALVYISAVSGGQFRSTATDGEGNFLAKDLDVALYQISVRLPAYITPPRDPEDNQTSYYYRVGDKARLTQIKGAVITGTVTNPVGDPVVNVAVRATLIRDAFGQTPKTLFWGQAERLTDDRGVYRMYGLAPGTYLVSAGSGRGIAFSVNAYDTDAPTFAPSSTRDTATEITLHPGEETSGVDIRYRGEPGRTLSGTISGQTVAGAIPTYFVTLMTVSNGTPISVNTSFQMPGNRGFSFSGVVDGDYDLVAQAQGGVTQDFSSSEPYHIKVRGADITGIELVTKALPLIAGKFVLEPSQVPECKGKRRPAFAETLFMAVSDEKDGVSSKFLRFSGNLATPDKEGSFTLRNLNPGQYSFDTRFFARYWYLQSISMEPAATPAAKGAAANQPIDAARRWTTLKLGGRPGNLKVTLAEGAASVRGQLTTAEGQKLPARTVVYLVPAEKEKAEDVLRFFATPVAGEGTFAENNLSPGRYWLLAQVPAENAPVTTIKLRRPDENTTRTKLRRDAEALKTELELKPCQNLADYKLAFKP